MLLLLVGMMVSSCHAERMIRRGLLGVGGVYGQEQRLRVAKGKAIEGYKEKSTSVQYPERSVDNHHSIPRQYYNDPPDDDDNGNGTP